jgi:hypothetical protein
VKDIGGYKHANGQESIMAQVRFDGSSSRPGRRRRSRILGDLLVWDEAMVIPDTVVGSQKPTLRASKAPHGPKVIYAGSAVDEEVHEYGVNFARIRERGIAENPRLSYVEWSRRWMIRRSSRRS